MRPPSNKSQKQTPRIGQMLMMGNGGAASMRRPDLSRVDVATQTPVIPNLMPYCHASIRTLSEFFCELGAHWCSLKVGAAILASVSRY
jgi:hypothetical protein